MSAEQQTPHHTPRRWLVPGVAALTVLAVAVGSGAALNTWRDRDRAADPPVLRLGGTGSGAGTNELAAAVRDGSAGYRLTGKLPAGPGDARVYRLTDRALDTAAVTGLAQALGLAAPAKRTPDAWVASSRDGQLWVEPQRGQHWYYTYGVGAAGPSGSVSSPVAPDSASASGQPPTGAAPTEEQARRTARPVFEAVGLRVQDARFAAVPGGAVLTVQPTVDGRPTEGMETRVVVDRTRVTSASGWRGTPVAAQTYPVVSAQQAFEQLQRGPVPLGGPALGGPVDDGPAGGAAERPATGTGSGAGSAEKAPAGSSPVDAGSGSGERGAGSNSGSGVGPAAPGGNQVAPLPAGPNDVPPQPADPNVGAADPQPALPAPAGPRQGSTVAVPVQPGSPRCAQPKADGTRSPALCAMPAPRPAEVTGAAFGYSLQWQETSPLLVPSWLFTLATGGTVAQVAVEPRFLALPGAGPGGPPAGGPPATGRPKSIPPAPPAATVPLPGQEAPGGGANGSGGSTGSGGAAAPGDPGQQPSNGLARVRAAQVGADGRTLTLTLDGGPASGPCTTTYTAWGKTEPERAVIAVQGDIPSPLAEVRCMTSGHPRTVTVRLDRALGDRPVVDGATGRPVPQVVRR